MIIGDLFFLLGFVTLYALELWFYLFKAEKLAVNEFEYSIYWSFTGGITAVLLCLKCYYGTKFLYYCTDKYKKKLKASISNQTVKKGGVIE
jgi:hypothetical protein